MASDRAKLQLKTHKSGWNLPSGFDLENFEKLLDYKQDKGDVIIMTYPKCGTTWTQFIMYLLTHDCKPIPEGKELYDFVPFLEISMDPLKNLPRPRPMKVHLNFQLLEYKENVKYICVVRNPKDCCVSFYNHVKGFPDYYGFEEGSFDDFFEAFIEGEIECNDYFDHLLSLYNHRQKPNVLFLLYEEMKEDPVEAVRKVANFISDVFPHINLSDELIEKVAHESSFRKMKESIGNGLDAHRSEDAPSFMRKGIVGDWVNYFNEDQVRRLETKFAEKLNGTGAENLWKKYGI